MSKVSIITRWHRGTFSNRKLVELLNQAEGEWFEVSIRKARHKPGSGMHRYYRGYLLPVLANAMNEAGCEVNGNRINIEWLHHHLKAKFLACVEWCDEQERFIHSVPSTGELDSRSMSEYIVRVERYAVDEWGVRLVDIEQ